MKKKYALLLAASVFTICSAFAITGCGGVDKHVLVKVDAHEATCVTAGNTEYYKCYDPDCGKLFSDPEGKNEVTLESVTINAKGHTLTGIGEAIDPTCTEDGITVGEKCSICGALVTGQQIVTKKGHTAIKVNGYAATCEADGMITYYACSDCHKNFLDDECEIEVQSVTIAAIGHNYSDWEYVGNGQHKKVCANDPTHVETVDCRYGKISDFTDGTGHYLTCTICDGTTDKLPHDLKWFIDGDEHWAECKECAYVSENEAHSPSQLDIKVTGSKLYGGRTITVNDISVTSVCKCGNKQEVATEDLTFEDTLLLEGKNTLSVAFDGYTQEFEYDAPAEPTYTLTIEGATFDGGEKTVNLKEGESLTTEVTLAEGKTFVGYRNGLTVMNDLTDFVMPDSACTIHALYEEDMVHFAPANKAQSQFSSETYDHVVLDNGIIATRFIWNSADTDLTKYPHSGADTGTHKVNVNSPAHGQSLMLVYVVNTGDKDLQIQYQNENYGVQGDITITAKAGETTRVPFVYGSTGGYGTFSTCDHRITLLTDLADGESATLDIYGKLVSTENNKLVSISASLPYDYNTFFEDGDTIDLSKLSVTGSISGYNVNLYDYTCNIENGTQWSSDIKEITVSYGELQSTIKLNSYDNWIHASLADNPQLVSPRGNPCDWLTAEHITDNDTGLPSTRFVFKAGTAANSEAFVNPSNDTGNGSNYNTSMPQHSGRARQVILFAKNPSDASIRVRVYWENYGDIGGIDVELASGESKQLLFTVTAGGPYPQTTGCCVNFKLLDAIGEEDVTVEMYTLYKSYYGEISGISVSDNGSQKMTFKVGDTFSADGVRLAPTTSFGSEGNCRIVNFNTDLDGHVFTEEDLGEKTVTVTWNGLTTTYKINVVAAE